MGRVRDSDGREDPLGVYVQWELACLLDVENGDWYIHRKEWESLVNLALQEYCIFLTCLISYYLGIMNINMKHTSKEHFRVCDPREQK